ncbi:MAG TPA: monovalent cation/H+ antiporter subunit D [Burkholderiales bacterium]|nr:monovalent cation/H+ antiporter subunit D [Burkholderiales bacterium]
MIAHLAVLPVVLPLAAGALMLFFEDRRHGAKAVIGIAAALAAAAAALALLARGPATVVYALGAWPAPFGIVLVADRLSALMVLLAAALTLAILVFSLARWHGVGPHFHSLVQFLLAGLSGAFLTGDLFNLFVFFELLLAASYGLALYGGGTPRVRASLHYIVVNLAASLLFLVGVSLMYGVAGTLNIADLALRVPHVSPPDRVLLEAGAAALGIAFLVKAGMWPLGFWLPGTYAAAPAPSAALFAILTKVGLYAVMRVWLVVFGGGPGAELLAYGGMATLAYGVLGMLASQDLGRLAGYSLLVSSGTLLAAVGLGGPLVTAAAIYYLVASTLGIAAFFLLVELVDRGREPGADVLAVTAEAFGLSGDEPEPEEEVGVAIPAAMALLGIAFACSALLIAGLPPLPGFVAKFAILGALLEADPVPAGAWILLALLVLSGLAGLVALGRSGVRIFWASEERTVPRVRLIEMAPVGALLAACIALTLAAGPAMRFAHEAAQGLHAPAGYVEEVLPRP